jgi:integrase
LINEDEEGKHIKNASSKRRVPLHLDLINAGFVAFYNQRKQKAKENQFLFPDLKATKYGVRSDSFSKWINRRIDRVNDDQTIACHSFRHLYRELVSEVVPAIEEEVKDRLLGHSSTSVGRKYGGKYYPMPALVDAIDRLVLPFQIPKINRNDF